MEMAFIAKMPDTSLDLPLASNFGQEIHNPLLNPSVLSWYHYIKYKLECHQSIVIAHIHLDAEDRSIPDLCYFTWPTKYNCISVYHTDLSGFLFGHNINCQNAHHSVLMVMMSNVGETKTQEKRDLFNWDDREIMKINVIVKLPEVVLGTRIKTLNLPF